jgi:hypothetical protein
MMASCAAFIRLGPRAGAAAVGITQPIAISGGSPCGGGAAQAKRRTGSTTAVIILKKAAALILHSCYKLSQSLNRTPFIISLRQYRQYTGFYCFRQSGYNYYGKIGTFPCMQIDIQGMLEVWRK